MILCRDGMRRPFPLTLTLSLGERERRARVSTCSNARPAHSALRFATSLWTGLPLSRGEGRGEGKRNVIEHLALACGPRLLPSVGNIRTACNSVFPLTLALSLGEREQRAGVSVSSNARPAHSALRFATSLGTGLPLPKGEGRGEGKRMFIGRLAAWLAHAV